VLAGVVSWSGLPSPVTPVPCEAVRWDSKPLPEVLGLKWESKAPPSNRDAEDSPRYIERLEKAGQ
jgi:hypothetical protein